MHLVWATRGRDWGFRFLLAGGFTDPLPAYESLFSGLEGEATLYRRVGPRVSLRFPDPLDRRDSAGRPIEHDFVLLPPLADEVGSVEEGVLKVWPLVADAYAGLWDRPEPPSETAVRAALGSTPGAHQPGTDDTPNGSGGYPNGIARLTPPTIIAVVMMALPVVVWVALRTLRGRNRSRTRKSDPI